MDWEIFDSALELGVTDLMQDCTSEPCRKEAVLSVFGTPSNTKKRRHVS